MQKKIEKNGERATFSVSELKKLIEGASDTDTVSVRTSRGYNQFDVGSTTLTLNIIEEV